MALTGYAPISFIQGEAYKFQIEFDENSGQFITSVFISSADVGFCHSLTQNDENPNIWSYIFNKEESLNFKPQTTTYSITAHSSLEELEPQILIESIEIIANKDKQICEV